MATRSTSMGRSRAVCLVAVAAAVLMWCPPRAVRQAQRFMDGPALCDCGRQIGVAGAFLPVKFTPGGFAEPNASIELVANCDVGVQVAISDPAFTIAGAIHTKDGAYQAVQSTFGARPARPAP